jgi:hypothetical protein
VGDGHDGAFEVVQEALQPGHGFRIQVVGRFVQQQHVRFSSSRRHSATRRRSPPERLLDLGVPVRQAQGVGRALQLDVHVVTTVGCDDGFQLALFAGQLVKIGIRVGVGAYTSSRPFMARFTSPTASSTASRTVCSGSSFGSWAGSRS